MDPVIQALEPTIRQILSSPGIDLATISAKRVRKQLLELVPSLPPAIFRDSDKKEQVDAIIAKVYGQVSASNADDDDDVSPKRKREDASDGETSAPPKKSKKVKSKQEQTDAELARQIQSELNSRGRSSRAASSKTKANGTKRGAKKGPKSSATVNSDGEQGSGEDDAKPKKRGGGFKKEYALRSVFLTHLFPFARLDSPSSSSEPLAALIGLEKLSRPQIVKQLWDHIKANNMQNPENKKEIICDDSFRSIFKCDRIDMFKMNKELGQHLYEPPVAS
ncbi:SWIB-domain-containing protein [Daedaleopsis nitida]|nr:SWIB-domain-containing protein [Daedaleopsis nitida]